MTAADLKLMEAAIARRRAEKAEFFAQLLFMFSIPSDQLNANRDFEWQELRRAAITARGRDYGVPSHTCRLMILARLREMEFRKGRAA